MKAIVWTKYGSPDVLRLEEVEKPTPKDNEVLIRICAATVTLGDCEMRSLKFPLFLSLPMRLYVGIIKPTRIKIVGQELSGEIESVGKEVKRYKEGDQVFASTAFGGGAYAEYKCMPEEPKEMEGQLGIKPTNMTYAEAAAVPVGGLEALHFIRQANIQSGHKVLINGAGGSIGTFAVQLAKYFGAEVTGVDSTGKLDMLRSIGADKVIDYTQEDFAVLAVRASAVRASAARVSAGRQNGGIYDVIFDVVGKSSFVDSIRALKQEGFYLLANPRLSQLIRGNRTLKGSGKKVIAGNVSNNPEDLNFLKELIEAGKLKSVIDRSFPLERTVEAHRYVETGQKKGNVVISVEHENKP